MTIFITGITGFLGSHLGEILCSRFQIVATKRNTSNLENCLSYSNQVNWINIDNEKWKEAVIFYKPQIIIHAAWIGVLASERDNWGLQSKNLLFVQDLLYIARQSGTQKIIGLGSQAEYGFIDTLITESSPLKPTSAYGALKIVASQLIQNFCLTNQIQWYWLRVFSVFGEREGIEWLLPNLIQTIVAKKVNKIALSPGEQQYAYLYVRDFAIIIAKIIDEQSDKSSIYNISSNNPLRLKELITFVRDIIAPDFILEFGALPYRQNQSMFIAGDTTLFNRAFGDINQTPLAVGIGNTIQFYTTKLLNESI